MKPGTFNLFDEPTASVDAKGASLIWNALFERLASRALICVTHDLQGLSRFDRVLVFECGEVIADGPWQRIAMTERVQDVISRIRTEVL
ncbi:hypothetical protein [Pseudomonas sp. Seg1]|uniref:hypothetical protein n=1 Tax=Pseudomonas sp. Seg1 TaxID=2678259 RepID=UPI001BB4247B|nr:hypothetical protein [Pseudomonas sp. Seg1]